jgi:hypothetical protein
VLRDEITHWQAQVDAETTRAGGTSARKPIQAVMGDLAHAAASQYRAIV